MFKRLRPGTIAAVLVAAAVGVGVPPPAAASAAPAPVPAPAPAPVKAGPPAPAPALAAPVPPPPPPPLAPPAPPAPPPVQAPEAAPEPAPEPVPVSGSSVEDAIRANFGDVADQAIRVARCESGLDPTAVSPGGGNWGLFQINSVHRGSFESVTGRPWSDVVDPDANAAFAAWLYQSSGGWGPWGCRWAA